jgi:hypothetical protein
MLGERSLCRCPLPIGPAIRLLAVEPKEPAEMNKRTATVISGAMVVALLAGMVGANRAAIQASTTRPQAVVVQRAAPPSPKQTFTERE